MASDCKNSIATTLFNLMKRYLMGGRSRFSPGSNQTPSDVLDLVIYYTFVHIPRSPSSWLSVILTSNNIHGLIDKQKSITELKTLDV